MKNPEHESGYFEDGSDVEIIGESERSTIAGGRGTCKWNSGSAGSGGSGGSCSLAKAINDLDVSDSPASPQAAHIILDQENDRRRQTRGKCHANKKRR